MLASIPRYGAVALFAALLWINVRKTLWIGIQGWGRPYWWLDYHHGFVRRGLAGEVFQAIFGRLTENQLIVPVGWENRACLLVLGGAVLFQLNAALRAQVDGKRIALVVAVTLWAAASQFWPTVAYTQGYLDSLVLALAALAALLMRAKLYWAVGVCVVIGPFIHEYFCFLVPFVLASDRIVAEEMEAAPSGALVGLDVEQPEIGVRRHLLWLAAVALAAAAVVMLLPAATAARQEIDAMPLSSADRGILATVTMTQTLQQSLAACLSLFFRNPGFTLKNLLFFSGPGLLATSALLLWAGRRPNVAMWLRAAAALFPIAALALAWDLSRLLVMADFTAAMLFLMTVQDIAVAGSEDRPLARWTVLAGAGVAGMLALGYLILPLAYVYYPPGSATLFTLTTPFGLRPRSLGVEKLWPIVQTAGLSESLPSDQKRLGPQLLHDLQPIAGVSEAGFLGWRIAPQPAERLTLYGPYIDLKAGRFRATYHLRAQNRSGVCPAPEARINGTTTDEHKPVTSQTRVDGAGGCAWTVSADVDVPNGGAAAMETHLFLKSAEPLLVDRYALEPAASAQSR